MWVPWGWSPARSAPLRSPVDPAPLTASLWQSQSRPQPGCSPASLAPLTGVCSEHAAAVTPSARTKSQTQSCHVLAGSSHSRALQAALSFRDISGGPVPWVWRQFQPKLLT